eukprot:6108347-Prymnesium_polylepis.1
MPHINRGPTAENRRCRASAQPRRRRIILLRDPRAEGRHARCELQDLLVAKEDDGHLAILGVDRLVLLLGQRVDLKRLVRHLVEVEQRLDLVAEGAA